MKRFHRFLHLARFCVALYLFTLLAFAQTTSRDLGAVRPADQPVRVVAFGDFGYAGSGSGQRAVSDAIYSLHTRAPFNLGLTLGDNFYPRGVRSLTDPHWKNQWHDHYDKLGIFFYPTLGNHDYSGNAEMQVGYTRQPGNKSWYMPFRFYTFTAGPVRFFALDTVEAKARLFRPRPWSLDQQQWLAAELAKPTPARWTVVYGHHPIYSEGHHGDTGRLERQLLGILKQHKVDVYVAGHEHDLQHIERDGIQFIIAGGGGKNTRRVRARRAVCAVGAHGFLELEATEKQLTLRLMGTQGQPLCPVKVLTK